MLPVLLHGLGMLEIRWLREFEYRLYDTRLRLTAPEGLDPRVVIIDIDEKSLEVLGQWPWKRDVLARLVERLFADYDIGLLGLDVVFAEPDTDPTLTALRDLRSRQNLSALPGVEELAASPDRDVRFAQVLSRYPVVMGYTFGQDPAQASVGALPPPLFDSESEIAALTRAPAAIRHTGNLGLLQGGRPGGFFSLLGGVDSDGIIRRVPLLNRYDGALYPTLSLVTAAAWLGTDIGVVRDAGGGEHYAGLEALDFGTHRIALDQNASVWVPYRASPGLFRRVSAVDVLRGEAPEAGTLAGVVALLGTSAAGLVDNRATPIHPVFPGVEIHASLVSGLLDGGFRAHPGWAVGAERLALGVVALSLVLLLPGLGALAMTLVSFAMAAALIGANLWLWIRQDFILVLAPVLAAVLAVYLVNLVIGYFVESRSRKQLRQSFGLYVPPQIIERMQGRSVEDLLRSEKRELTVLFTDIRGFTPISESMPPEELSQLMNAFLTPMTAIVHRQGGAIDKYMGDAMMAFWGAPVEQEDHATRAADAALEMIESLETLNRDFAARGWPVVRIGIGLNTGAMSVGNMGSEFRMAYTVLGDAVNLGSRIEGLTAQYGVPVLMSESTARGCPHLELLEVDRVRVKGKAEPVRLFTPLGRKGEVSDTRRERAARFRAAADAMSARQFEKAREAFEALEAESMASAKPAAEVALFAAFHARAADYALSPPGPDWDGVMDFKVK